jgi:hypothetical protein
MISLGNVFMPDSSQPAAVRSLVRQRYQIRDDSYINDERLLDRLL